MEEESSRLECREGYLFFWPRIQWCGTRYIHTLLDWEGMYILRYEEEVHMPHQEREKREKEGAS
jgi:hypothetical protein